MESHFGFPSSLSPLGFMNSCRSVYHSIDHHKILHSFYAFPGYCFSLNISLSFALGRKWTLAAKQFPTPINQTPGQYRLFWSSDPSLSKRHQPVTEPSIHPSIEPTEAPNENDPECTYTLQYAYTFAFVYAWILLAVSLVTNQADLRRWKKPLAWFHPMELFRMHIFWHVI